MTEESVSGKGISETEENRKKIAELTHQQIEMQLIAEVMHEKQNHRQKPYL